MTTPPAPPREVWFHHMPQWLTSMSNKPIGEDYYDKYFMPPGAIEGTADHRKSGGYWRHRPSQAVVGPRPRPEADWALRDAIDECREAQRYGATGFANDLIGAPGSTNFTRQMRMLDAAAEVEGFKVLTMADCTTSFGGQTAAEMAQTLVGIASHEASYKLPDGRFVLSTFKAEGKTAAYWRDVIARLQNLLGLGVAFWPVFLNYATGISLGIADIPEVVGLGVWGGRTPGARAGHTANAADAHARGKWWMAPVAAQDSRPQDGTAYESEGPRTLAETWGSAIESKAEAVQAITFNDLPENSAMCSTAASGRSWLVLNKYLAETWRTGRPPALKDDLVFVCNRRQMSSARGTYAPPTGITYTRMSFRTGNTPVDRVYVVTALREERRVVTTIGSKVYVSERPRGLKIEDYPAVADATPLVRVTSDGVNYEIAGHTISASPFVQDLSYSAVVRTEDPFAAEEDPAVIAQLEQEVAALTAQNSTLAAVNTALTTARDEAVSRAIGAERKLERAQITIGNYQAAAAALSEYTE